MEHGPESRYRADIDGLRAIAVLAVVAYHAWPYRVRGGFVGVDVFFVISGYLISRLIFADLAAGRFTIARFYGRRIRRIFPALAAALSAVCIAGWLFLLPDEWAMLGKHLFAGVAFVANLALAREGGDYFAFAAHAKPLLHLWSLGVEEQFYFVWPLLLFMLRNRSRRTTAVILGIVLAGSFLLNVALVSRYQQYTFYLPMTRLWELALGSLVALLEPARACAQRASWLLHVASGAGILLCIASIVFVTEEQFPGWQALAPTVATLLLIVAGSDALVNRYLLSSRAAVAIGLISYPLYLWHWPLLYFFRLFTIGEMPYGAAAVWLAANVLLAALTYRFVETPVRSRPVRSAQLKFVVAVMVIVAAAGVAAWRGLLPARLQSPQVARTLEATTDWACPFDNFGRTDGFEVYTVPGRPGKATVLIGDSHLQQYWPRFELLASRGLTPEMRFVTNGGCPPLRGLSNRGEVCDRFLDFALAEARRSDVDRVVFGAAWSKYGGDPNGPLARQVFGEFSNDIANLVRSGKRVDVILSSPSSESFEPRNSVSRLDGTIVPPMPISVASIRAVNGAADANVRDAAIRGGGTVIDPLPFLCPSGLCPGYASDRGPMYKDGNHLRPFYVRERALFIDALLTNDRGR